MIFTTDTIGETLGVAFNFICPQPFKIVFDNALEAGVVRCYDNLGLEQGHVSALNAREVLEVKLYVVLLNFDLLPKFYLRSQLKNNAFGSPPVSQHHQLLLAEHYHNVPGANKLESY